MNGGPHDQGVPEAIDARLFRPIMRSPVFIVGAITWCTVVAGVTDSTEVYPSAPKVAPRAVWMPC